MVSILDIYDRAHYWHVFVPARRWHKEIPALNGSQEEGLPYTGEVGINKPSRPVPPRTDAWVQGEETSVPAPRWRGDIDITV